MGSDALQTEETRGQRKGGGECRSWQKQDRMNGRNSACRYICRSGRNPDCSPGPVGRRSLEKRKDPKDWIWRCGFSRKDLIYKRL